MERREGTAQDGDLANLTAFRGPLDIRSLALTGLLILAVFYTLYVAKAIVLPVVLALLLNFLLAPLVRALHRLRLPNPVGAALILGLSLGTVGSAAYYLATPLSEWLDQVPRMARTLELRLREVKEPVDKVSQATQQVEKLTKAAAAEPPQVTVQTASLIDLLFTQTWGFLFGAAVMMILLFFLLSSGDLFLRKLVTVVPRFSDKRRVVQIAHQIEQSVSVYLVSITAINLALGVFVGMTMAWLGMPTPWLWGAMATLFNFIPYLGAVAGVAVLSLVASSTFTTAGHVVLPPVIYLALSTIEGNVLTPLILGCRLTLNPVVIFLNLIFWGWIWGVAGALLAVPILAVFKLICDHIQPLAAIGEFLGE